jgi:hypothetical protein
LFGPSKEFILPVGSFSILPGRKCFLSYCFLEIVSGNRFDGSLDRFALPCTCLYMLSSCLLQLAQYLRPCPFRRPNDALFLPTGSHSGLSQYSLSHYAFMADTHKSPLPQDLSSLNSSPLLPLSSKQAPLTGSCQQKSRPFFNITCKDGQNLPTESILRRSIRVAKKMWMPKRGNVRQWCLHK